MTNNRKMNKRLRDNVTSGYMEAANRMTSKKARRKIIAYVESYDDIFFWRTVLSRFEDNTRYFEVMLPTHNTTLGRGKKSVLMNLLCNKVGRDMIACVDADYDYLIKDATQTSRQVRNNPYVFHTYVYAIENYQCYAPSLHNVCVMVTLNDSNIFDFEEFIQAFSEIIFPLFVWSIWHYRRPVYNDFTISDFNKVIDLGGFNLEKPEACLNNVRYKVGRKISWLQKRNPKAKESYLKLKKEIQEMGVTPETTYLYIQGHHLFDKIIKQVVGKVCSRLIRDREQEIRSQSLHSTQMRNELSCYSNSIQDIGQMMKKNTGYTTSEPFMRLQKEIEMFLAKGATSAKHPAGMSETPHIPTTGIAKVEF